MNHLKAAAMFMLTREICPVGLEEVQRHSFCAVIKYKQWRKGPVGQERWLLLQTC